MRSMKKSAKRFLSLLLTAAMLLSVLPGNVLAVYAEDTGGGLCVHHMEHTAECGYMAAQAEVPCDMDCTDEDGDGVTDHAEGCAYTPAVEGRPCAYACSICPVQTLIDALPDAGDITADNAEDVKAQLSAIDKALAVLTEDERGQVDTGRYTAAAEALAALTQENEPEETEPVEVSSGSKTETYVPGENALPDNDELFAGYAWRIFYGENGFSPLGEYGGSSLSGTDKEIYDQLKAAVTTVAAEGGSTIFEIDLTDIDITCEVRTGVDSGDTLAAMIDDDTILAALLADCPYELYWFDKTEGISMSIGYYENPNTGIATLSNLSFDFYVAPAYQYEDADDDPLTWVDSGRASTAVTAAANAQAVITANAGKSDYEKLLAYKTYICNAVSYNSDAAKDDYDGGYSDPWQLIYVFDGDGSTNVVCEGYSKAFQYLCDLSGLTVYTVTGNMSGDGVVGAGEHMWNIVTLDGANYLVDVTNSDDGTVGANGGLFLAGTSGSVESGYTFTVGSQTITFTYDSDTTSLYGDSILTLAETDYHPTAEEQADVATVTINGTATTYSYSESGSYTTAADALKAAWTSAQNADVSAITLLADVSLTAELTTSKTLTLDLNGHTLTNTSGNGIYCTGTLTVQDSAGGGGIRAKGKAIRASGENAVLTIHSGTFSGTEENGAAAVQVQIGGTLYIKGGTFTSDNIAVSLLNPAGYATKTYAYITGGTISGDSSASGAAVGLQVYGGSTGETVAEVSDNAVITGKCGLLVTHENAKIYVSDGQFSGKEHAVSVEKAGSLYVKGGTFTGGTNSTITLTTDACGEVEITGGDFYKGRWGYFVTGTGSVQQFVKGGTFHDGDPASTYFSYVSGWKPLCDGYVSKLSSGSAYTVDLCTEHSWTLKDDGDGTQKLVCEYCGATEQAVATVTIDGVTTPYADIQAAFTAAKGNTATVTLLADAEVTSTLEVEDGDNITLQSADGSDFVLSGAIADEKGVIGISGGTLTIKSGTVENTLTRYRFCKGNDHRAICDRLRYRRRGQDLRWHHGCYAELCGRDL